MRSVFVSFLAQLDYQPDERSCVEQHCVSLLHFQIEVEISLSLGAKLRLEARPTADCLQRLIENKYAVEQDPDEGRYGQDHTSNFIFPSQHDSVGSHMYWLFCGTGSLRYLLTFPLQTP